MDKLLISNKININHVKKYCIANPGVLLSTVHLPLPLHLPRVCSEIRAQGPYDPWQQFLLFLLMFSNFLLCKSHVFWSNTYIVVADTVCLLWFTDAFLFWRKKRGSHRQFQWIQASLSHCLVIKGARTLLGNLTIERILCNHLWAAGCLDTIPATNMTTLLKERLEDYFG